MDHPDNAAPTSAPATGAASFASYAERYLAHARVADTTMELYRSNLRRHVVPALGGRSLGSARRSDTVAFVTEPSATLAPSTVKLVYEITSGILRSVVDDRLILVSPYSGVPLPTPAAPSPDMRSTSGPGTDA